MSTSTAGSLDSVGLGDLWASVSIPGCPGDRRVIHSSAHGHPGCCRCPSAAGGPCPVASELPSLPRSAPSSANAWQRLPHGPHPVEGTVPTAHTAPDRASVSPGPGLHRAHWTGPVIHQDVTKPSAAGRASGHRTSEKSRAWGAKRQESLHGRCGCDSRVSQVGSTGPRPPAPEPRCQGQGVSLQAKGT